MKTVSFRTPSLKLQKIDKLAGAQRRDRTYILNEAIDQYLSLQEYHIRLIEEGIRADEEGRVVPHEQVMRALTAQRAARKKKAR